LTSDLAGELTLTGSPRHLDGFWGWSEENKKDVGKKRRNKM